VPIYTIALQTKNLQSEKVSDMCITASDIDSHNYTFENNNDVKLTNSNKINQFS